MSKLPKVVIIGTMKSGTTSLYSALIQHPDIIKGFKKELRYLHHNDPTAVGYQQLFNYASDNQITIEATPNYICSEKAARNAKKLIPEAIFIVLFRNPITRAYAHFLTECSDYMKDNETIEQSFIRFTEKIDSNHSIIKRGHYYEQLKIWLKYFPLNQFIFLESDNFFNNFETTVNNVINKLKFESFQVNPVRLNSNRANFAQRKVKYPELPSEAKYKLLNYYEPLNKKLYDLIDMNFKWELK